MLTFDEVMTIPENDLSIPLTNDNEIDKLIEEQKEYRMGGGPGWATQGENCDNLTHDGERGDGCRHLDALSSNCLPGTC